MSTIERTFCCEDFPTCGHRATRTLDGCVTYVRPDQEPDTEAELIADVSRQRYESQHPRTEAHV